MDGFEVLSYINKYQWNDTLAVIMISSDDSPENIKRAYSLGAFDFSAGHLIQQSSAAVYPILCFYMQDSAVSKILSQNSFMNRKDIIS